MRSFTRLAVALSLLSSALATVNSPAALVECQPIRLSWTATTSPYYLSIIGDGDAANVLEQLGTFTDTSYSWTVDLAAGTNVSIALTDGAGSPYYSSSVIVQAGSSTACLATDSATTQLGSATGVAASASNLATASGSSQTSQTESSSASRSSVSSSAAAGSTVAASASSSTTSATSGASSFALWSGLLAVVGGAVAFAC